VAKSHLRSRTARCARQSPPGLVSLLAPTNCTRLRQGFLHRWGGARLDGLSAKLAQRLTRSSRRASGRSSGRASNITSASRSARITGTVSRPARAPFLVLCCAISSNGRSCVLPFRQGITVVAVSPARSPTPQDLSHAAVRHESTGALTKQQIDDGPSRLSARIRRPILHKVKRVRGLGAPVHHRPTDCSNTMMKPCQVGRWDLAQNRACGKHRSKGRHCHEGQPQCRFGKCR